MSSLKYKVGDKVLIKSRQYFYDNEVVIGGLLKDDSSIYFAQEMVQFCGEEAEVIKIDNGCYRLSVDKGWFLWSESMLKSVEVKETEDVSCEEAVKAIGRYISAMRSCGGYKESDIDIPVIIAIDKIIMVEASVNGKYCHVSVENMSDTICLKCTINEIMSIMGQSYSPVPVMSC